VASRDSNSGPPYPKLSHAAPWKNVTIFCTHARPNNTNLVESGIAWKCTNFLPDYIYKPWTYKICVLTCSGTGEFSRNVIRTVMIYSLCKTNFVQYICIIAATIKNICEL
jgi:hypothetical protein